MTGRIVLVGLRGTGKTTVGRLVADALGWPFADCDEVVQHAAGRSVAEIFATEGEAGFRARESLALSELLARDPLVLATGGGAVLDAANRARIRAAGFVAWLHADPTLLALRVAADPRTARTRPTLTGLSPREELNVLAEHRRPLYREVARLELDVGDLSPAGASARILRAWHNLVEDR